MIAVDASVLAYAVNRHAPQHARAASALEALANGDRPWALPWPSRIWFSITLRKPSPSATFLILC